MDRYQVIETLAQIKSTQVLRAIRRSSKMNLAVVLKRQSHDSIEGVNRVFTEMINQQTVGHRAVCCIYECLLSEDQRLMETTLVLESMKTDLYNDLQRRRGSSERWPESKLWYIARELVDALSCAQSKQVSHRDIKPENIFLTANDEVKIGDFGSSKMLANPLQDVHSLQGTPPYFCPLLRVAYIQCLSEGNQTVNLTHNLYKSDVFALGMTLLTVARLKSPTDLTVLEGLQQKLESAIADLPYSPGFKSLLKVMTATEETDRPDFLALQGMLGNKDFTTPNAYGLFPVWCSICSRPSEYIAGNWVCQSASPSSH